MSSASAYYSWESRTDDDNLYSTYIYFNPYNARSSYGTYSKNDKLYKDNLITDTGKLKDVLRYKYPISHEVYHATKLPYGFHNRRVNLLYPDGSVVSARFEAQMNVRGSTTSAAMAIWRYWSGPSPKYW